MMPPSPSSSQQEKTEEDKDGNKKIVKTKKGGKEGSLSSNSHFCHHLEAPLAFALLLPPR
jgi:hypothetical protein